MRLREQVIGALNLFRAVPGPIEPGDLRIGQALADVATIGLLQERHVRRSETVAEQLQAALNSRVVIEQAKGKLAERLGLDMDQAFGLLRTTPATATSGSPTSPATSSTAPPPTSRPRPAGNCDTAPGTRRRHPLPGIGNRAIRDSWQAC